MSRSRKRQETTFEEKETVQPIDSDDQEQIVQEITRELHQQQVVINYAFRGICIGVILVCLSGAAWIELDSRRSRSPLPVASLRHLHTLTAVVVHGVALTTTGSSSSTNTNNAHKPVTSMIGSLYTQLWKWIFHLVSLLALVFGALTVTITRKMAGVGGGHGDMAHRFHQALLVSDIVTTAVALWLKSELQSSHQALDDLQSSKYKFKSL